MKPGVPLVATEIAHRLRTDILTQLSGFPANVAAMSAQMLDMIAQHWDDAAQNLVEENDAFRQALAEGAALYGSADWAALGSGSTADVRIPTLARANEELRAGLILLHARVENDASAAARPVEEAIWSALRRSVELRRMASANF